MNDWPTPEWLTLMEATGRGEIDGHVTGAVLRMVDTWPSGENRIGVLLTHYESGAGERHPALWMVRCAAGSTPDRVRVARLDHGKGEDGYCHVAWEDALASAWLRPPGGWDSVGVDTDGRMLASYGPKRLLDAGADPWVVAGLACMSVVLSHTTSDELNTVATRLRSGEASTFGAAVDLAAEIRTRYDLNLPFTTTATTTSTTNHGDDEPMTPTTTPTDLADLIPDADKWVDAALNNPTAFPDGVNIMLTGRHGTGKTEAVKALCRRHGLTMIYFQCQTLDAYVDLVGLPVTRIGADGREVVVKVPPNGVLDAQVLFFDEPNRAEPATLNALFELLASRSVNGTPSAARMVFSAINPSDDDSYHVGQLDQAFESRYHLRVAFEPKPLPDVIAQRVDLPLAKAACEWWETSNHEKRETYISPRTLTALVCAWSVVPAVGTLDMALPGGTVADTGRLHALLAKAAGMKVPKKKDDDALASTTPTDPTPASTPTVGKPIAFRRSMMKNDAALDRLTAHVESGRGDRVLAGLDANSQPTWSRMCQDLLKHAMEHADGYDACIKRWLPIVDMLNGKFASPKVPVPASVR